MTTMKKMKWSFSQSSENNNFCGEFSVNNANKINRLYFPLFNMSGFMSAITPDLKGDIKTGQNTFLLEPQVSENIMQTKNSRNFWIKTDDNKVWSVPGVSADEYFKMIKKPSYGSTKVTASPGHFQIKRNNQNLQVQSTIDVFVPFNDQLEVSIITIKNNGTKTLNFTATSAVPIYGRSADNLRDHRQVTTLLNRIKKDDNGIIMTPTMSFDERGHKSGKMSYSTHAFNESGEKLSGIISDLETFIGEGGSLEAPYMIYSKDKFIDKNFTDGKQTIGALQFTKSSLKAGDSTSFVVILGIQDKSIDIHSILKKYNSPAKSFTELQNTKNYWQDQINRLKIQTSDNDYDNWFIWVSMQPVMRRVFGCSFLPDFGYGRGGRGWRDLWQDCLGILLTNPKEAKELLLNNIQGVRIDGSNATIIGSKPGEFIADRNNIPRTWMDHGVWPLITIALYIEQTGDIDILLEKRPFFSDRFSHRSKKINTNWTEKNGTKAKLKDGSIYDAPIFIHLLIQNITQFYNRGDKNNIKLEDADWNDGLDMAAEKGESVPFTAAYAENLKKLSLYCEKLVLKGIKSIPVPIEIEYIVNFEPKKNEYENPSFLRNILTHYFDKTQEQISDKVKELDLDKLSKSLLKKANTLKKSVRENEFLDTGKHQYFNGYYNNEGLRVEGLIKDDEQITLTGQVFPIMTETATISQAKKAYKAAKDLLKDKNLGGYRLNSNFNKIMLNLGRAYSFSYGDKENGGFFSHMNVMFANALYKRGLVKEGYEVLNSIYKMCHKTEKSMIFPCVPEYFNGFGRGLYCYITGSGSWLVMTMVTEVFGIKGDFGKLSFQPKLLNKQFNMNNEAIIETLFKGEKIKVKYYNPEKLSYGKYTIKEITCDDKTVNFTINDDKAIVDDDICTKQNQLQCYTVVLSKK